MFKLRNETTAEAVLSRFLFALFIPPPPQPSAASPDPVKSTGFHFSTEWEELTVASIHTELNLSGFLAATAGGRSMSKWPARCFILVLKPKDYKCTWSGAAELKAGSERWGFYGKCCFNPQIVGLLISPFKISSHLCFCRKAEQLHSPCGSRTWRFPMWPVPMSRLPSEELHPFVLWARVPHQGPSLQVSPREVAASDTCLHPCQRWESGDLTWLLFTL